jgi:peptidylprolyl isomerase
MSEEKKPTEEIKQEKVEVPVTEAKSDEVKAEVQAEVPVTETKPEEATVEVKTDKPIEEPRIEGAVNKGDFILMEMTGKAETGEVFDATSEELAKEKGIHREDRVYGARLVVVGEGMVLKGLDNRLRGVKPNEVTNIEILASEAFGERDASLMQLIPFRLLRSKGINPVPGAELEIDGRQAVIRSVGAGRVQVDYNHPLAGRKVFYEIKVNEIIEDENAKIKALINRRFVGIEAEKFKTKKTAKKLVVDVPDEIFFGENIQVAKRGLAMDLLKYFPEVEEVEFKEVVKR